jgi:hypothetical protein
MLTNRPSRFLPPEAQLYFRDVYDHMLRITDALDSYRELMSSTLDSYLSQVSNRLGSVSKGLAVFGALSIPFVVIAGVYGMNFEHIPLAHHRWGFEIMVAIQVAGVADAADRHASKAHAAERAARCVSLRTHGRIARLAAGPRSHGARTASSRRRSASTYREARPSDAAHCSRRRTAHAASRTMTSRAVPRRSASAAWLIPRSSVLVLGELGAFDEIAGDTCGHTVLRQLVEALEQHVRASRDAAQGEARELGLLGEQPLHDGGREHGAACRRGGRRRSPDTALRRRRGISPSMPPRSS